MVIEDALTRSWLHTTIALCKASSSTGNVVNTWKVAAVCTGERNKVASLDNSAADSSPPVSYTHLTLPTSR